MSERVAIVVGAGGELGRATAQALAATGYTVVGVDRNEEGLKELPDGIRREVGRRDRSGRGQGLIDKIAAQVGPPEVLVNTIGTFRLGEAVAATPDDLRLLMDVNLGAALWLSQAVEPYMRQSGKGSIVHVSARPGTDPTAGMAAYSLSKAALSHLVRILDLELRPHGIRVNAVAPQLINTAAQPDPVPAPNVLAHAVAAGGGRERHRLPRRGPRRARQRCDRPGLRCLTRIPDGVRPGRVVRARPVAGAPGRVRRDAAGRRRGLRAAARP